MAIFEYTHEMMETQANPITHDYTRVHLLKVSASDTTVPSLQFGYAKDAADSLGLTTTSAHPQDGLAFVTSNNAVLHHENDQNYWKVTVVYAEPADEDGATAPWLRANTLSVTPAGLTKQATLNYKDDPNGLAILNSAGTDFTTQLTIKLPVSAITENGAQLSFNVKSESDKVGLVNDGSLSLGGQAFPAGTLLLDSYTATEQVWEPTGQDYFEISATYLYDPVGLHTTKFLDAGIQERIGGAGGTLKAIRNGNNVPVGSPVALDGAGAALRAGKKLLNPVPQATANYIDVLPYKEGSIGII